MDRLSADDLTNLAVEAPDTPMHVGVLAMLDGRDLLDEDGRLRLPEIRGRIERRIGEVPRLRQIVHRAGPLAGRPLWVDDPAFAIERHVEHIEVPSPGGEEQLLRLAERVMGPLLDRAHPLWRLWFVTGLPAGRVAVVVKLHHAVADGLAAIRLISTLLGGPDGGSSGAPWAPQPPPRWRDLVGDRLAAWTRPRAAARRSSSDPRRPRRPWWRSLRGALHGLARARSAPRTSLNAPIGPRRRLAVVRLDLATAKTTAHAHGATVNDVILDLIAGGLRALLESRGEPVGLALHVAMAVSIRTADEVDQPGNRSGVIVVRLPLGHRDPAARLAAVRDETAGVKRDQHPSTEQHFLVWLAKSGLMRWYTRRQHLTNLVESNVTGPSERVTILGAPVLDLVPIGVLAGNLTIGFLALSYAGQLVISVWADADRHPDLPILVTAMGSEWISLEKGSQGGRQPSCKPASGRCTA